MINRFIFQPGPASYGADLDGLVAVAARDGAALAIIHLPEPTAARTVLFFHGNAMDLGQASPALDDLHAAGFAVLAFDYRGYGLSAGKPTEKNVYADTQDVIAFARAELGVMPDSLLLFGNSVGSGPAVHLATQIPVAGLVLLSPFASVFRVVTRVRLPFDPFNNLAKAGAVRCPTLVIHGTDDEIIRFADAESLFDALPEPKRHLWIEGAHHNDIWKLARDQILDALITLNRSLPGAP